MSALWQTVPLVAVAVYCLPWLGTDAQSTINPDTSDYVRAINHFRDLKCYLEPLIESVQSVRDVVKEACLEGSLADTPVRALPGVGDPIEADL